MNSNIKAVYTFDIGPARWSEEERTENVGQVIGYLSQHNKQFSLLSGQAFSNPGIIVHEASLVKHANVTTNDEIFDGCVIHIYG